MTRVRPATAADVDAVALLEKQIFGAEAWSRAAVEAEIGGVLRQGFVAAGEDGAVCGYVFVLGIGAAADLQRIAVTPPCRGRGVADALLAAVDLSPYHRMLLEVRSDNDRALEFYRRHGFAELCRRRAYYRDGTDAVVMERSAQ